MISTELWAGSDVTHLTEDVPIDIAEFDEYMGGRLRNTAICDLPTSRLPKLRPSTKILPELHSNAIGRCYPWKSPTYIMKLRWPDPTH